MKWYITVTWGVFALEVVLLLAWILFALREVGHDAGERVWTTIYGVLPAFALLAAGLLLSYGQRNGFSLATGLGCGLVYLPLAFLIGIKGTRAFNKWDRAQGHAKAEHRAIQFQNPLVAQIAQAIQQGDNVQAQRFLTDSRIDWADRNPDGQTLLEFAIGRWLDYDNPSDLAAESLRLLVEAGARLGPNTGPLMLQLLEHRKDSQRAVLDLVLRAGGDPNAKNSDGDALIHLPSCDRGLTELLARHGADLHAVCGRADRAGWSALMIAAHFSDWDKALYLLEKGVSPNHRAPDGTTLATILESRAEMAKGAGEKLSPGYHKLRKRISETTP